MKNLICSFQEITPFSLCTHSVLEKLHNLVLGASIMQEIINPSYEGNTKVTEDVFVVLHTSSRKQSLNGWRVRAPAIIQIEASVKSVNNIQISFQMKNGSVFLPIFGYHSHGRGHKTKSKNDGCEGLHNGGNGFAAGALLFCK